MYEQLPKYVRQKNTFKLFFFLEGNKNDDFDVAYLMFSEFFFQKREIIFRII